MIRKQGSRIAIVAVVAAFGLLLTVATRAQRSKPPLSLWHTVILESEFENGNDDGDFSWADYLDLEETLFEELDEKIVQPSSGNASPMWNRFAPRGVNNPAGFPRNWNRSYELAPSAPVGGALLIHGLTDSPYSLRRTAEIFNAHGFYVVGLRLPGHGTAPSAMRDADVEDWMAAVRIAYRHLLGSVESGHPIVVAGYSNGGALAIDLALDSIEDDQLPTPDRLVLYSPAIGITRAAAFAKAHRMLSWMPWFNKLGWSDVLPETDPFKYNSFPTDAGYQTHVLTRSIRKRLADLEHTGGAGDMPAVLTFMSLADATVRVEAVVEGLHDRLSNPKNELVVFDINRQAKMSDFFLVDPAERLRSLIERPTTPYRLTVISNLDETTSTLEEWSRPAGSTEVTMTPLGQEWPRGFYSLSHVAVPFPPDDPIYGTHPDPEQLFGVQLGTLEARGERNLLTVSAAQLIRLRSNPFFPYIEQRLRSLTGVGVSVPAEAFVTPGELD
jgi:alpha-beta hydrolase superfamily lysophospholipase